MAATESFFFFFLNIVKDIYYFFPQHIVKFKLLI